MLQCTLDICITETQFYTIPWASVQGYFKIRNSPTKFDCVGFKDVEKFFISLPRIVFMKKSTSLVLGSVLLSNCSVFILWILNFVMTVTHSLHWPLESLNQINGSTILIILASFQVQFYILALVIPSLYTFTVFTL